MTSKYFKADELCCKHCGERGVKQELVDALDALRELAGEPILVHDAYRCKRHNSAVSLVAKSVHPEGLAADIKIHNKTLQQMVDLALAIPAFCNGGIGAYPSEFIHVDVRGSRARWAFVAGTQVAITQLVNLDAETGSQDHTA